MEPNAAFTLVDGHIAVDEDSEPGYADILSLNLESGITSQEERLPIIPSELHNIIDYIGVDKIVRMSKDEVKEATRIGLPKLDQDRLVFVKNHVIPAVAAGSPNRTTLELVLTQALANAIFYEMMKEDSTLASVRGIIKQMSGVDLSQPVDLFREYEKDDLEAAFFQTFTDPDDYIEHLKNEIIRSSRSYGEDCYFPGVSIVQTSDELLKGNSDFEAYFKACYEVVNSNK
ncbi:hypothetical protein DFJ73DRAFT_772048 [Zopfochytrium polystomum]|nr:hypothetical protein DFJ73DRAFT_772048 [Zopfochytrium polystomum]